MAGNIRNCRRCGRLFVFVGGPVCPDCLAKEEEQYRKVKLYIDDHPGCGVQETSDETGVPVDIVVEFLRQGLLVTGSGPEGQLVCMICRRPITKGRICPRCEAALGMGSRPKVDQGRQVSQVSQVSRMYTMDSIGKKTN
ncbi:MAG: MerR family transcriptional regulator [Bacillota bacterium]